MATHPTACRKDLRIRFAECFGEITKSGELNEFFCPGRVNLIGEHTDYTGGLVFPCAINLGTHLIVRRTHDNRYHFASTNAAESRQLTSEQLPSDGKSGWYRYPCGVIDQFNSLNFSLDGLDLLYSGNIPNGAGLSSSASIEVVTAFAINALFDCGLSTLELIKLCQRAENEFVGTQSGVMDQFAVAAGIENHALMLDCHTLDYETIALDLGDHTLLIADSKQQHDNSAEDGYNTRVSECGQALSLLQQNIEIEHLGALSPAELDQQKAVFSDTPVLYKRVAHIVSENQRVRESATAMKANRLQDLGLLMHQSHISQSQNYAVSSDALDLMVKLAMEQPGVLGSRLTGGGFGGCTVNLVAVDKVDEIIDVVGTAYHQGTSLTPEFHIVKPSAGVHRVTQ